MPSAKKLIEIRFLLEDITCSGCAEDMENILLGMDGVEEASVIYPAGIFTIHFDPVEIEEKAIVKKVKSLGFKTKLLGR